MLNLRKPGTCTARVQGNALKINNQPVIGTTVFNGSASKYTPIMGLGGGSSFIYAPPADQADAFIEYNDRISRGFYVSSTIPNVEDLEEKTNVASTDQTYVASLQDVLMKQGANVISVSKDNGVCLDTSNSDQTIRIQLSNEGKLRISSNGVSDDFVLIASDTMNYLTQETQKHVLLISTLSAIIQSMLVTLNNLGPAPVTGAILAGLITPIQTILNSTILSNPPASMVSSKIKIPRG
jgi:hypothetical protein